MELPTAGALQSTLFSGPMTPKAFHAHFGRIGARAKMQFPIHPHMLRHGCGYALANAGHDTRALQAWLGHRARAEAGKRRFDLALIAGEQNFGLRAERQGRFLRLRDD